MAKAEMKMDPRLVKLLEHRDFFEDLSEYDDTVAEDDIVLDVLILARVKQPTEVGTGTSGLIIVSQNDTDDLMVEGMLSRAIAIQHDAGFTARGDDD